MKKNNAYKRKNTESESYRARSDATLTSSEAISQHIESDSRDPNADTRPSRVPMGRGYNLDTGDIVLDREHYYYRWIADVSNNPGRVQQAAIARYEHVTNEHGENVTRPAGDGGLSYFMRLPIEYRLEDLELKNQLVQDTMDQEAELGPGEYAPDPHTLEGEGGRSAITRSIAENPWDK